MKLAVRSAKLADETIVISLWRDGGLLVSYNDPSSDFRFALGKENSDVLVGEDESGSIVAAVMVGHDGHRGWIYYLAVKPKLQRNGLGRVIVTAAEDWLSERGVAKLNLMIRETNTKVIAFYETLRFVNEPRVVMGKRLKR